MTRGWCGAGRFAMGLRNIMALQKKTRGVVRLYQGISEIVADIWRPTVKDGLSFCDRRQLHSEPLCQPLFAVIAARTVAWRRAATWASTARPPVRSRSDTSISI